MQILQATRFSILGICLAFGSLACEKKNSAGNDNKTSSDGDSQSNDDDDTMTDDDDDDDDTMADDDDDDTPIVDMPSDDCGRMCNLFDQESCGADEMCAAWICDPENAGWDSSICGPVGEMQKGEACEHHWIGTPDTICGKGLTCFGGSCVDTCIGSKDDPSCPMDEDICVVQNNGNLAICLESCDPLAPACPDTQPLCIPAFGAEGFICSAAGPGADENGHGAPCMFNNVCKPGLLCLAKGTVDAPGCEANGCCGSICDTSMGEGQCQGEMEECTQWFDPPVPGYENVGACIIPMR